MGIKMADTEYVKCDNCKKEVLETEALFDEDIKKVFCSLQCNSEYIWSE